MAELTVTQIRSAIGSKPKQRGTLRALGLGKIGKTNTLPDRPEIRGMLDRVPHLVSVDGLGDSAPAPAAAPAPAPAVEETPADEAPAAEAEDNDASEDSDEDS